VQAIACDAMTGDMVQLHREGVPLVGTIHDEILALVRVEDAERTLQRMLEVMSTTPPWAPGLPLAAEGFINRRFIKPPKKGSGVGHTAADQPVGDGALADVRARVPPERADPAVPQGAGNGTAAARRSRDRGAGKAGPSTTDSFAPLTWPERIVRYNSVFPGRGSYLTWHTDGERPWLVGGWVLAYYARTPAARAANFWGAYPGDILKRYRAMFPDKRNILHGCSGMVDLKTLPGDTVDIRPEMKPTFCTDVQTMQGVPLDRYDLALFDVPYRPSDAEKYGTPMLVRKRVMRALEGLRADAHVVWLDEQVPPTARRPSSSRVSSP
jgi:hypothetical protein